MLVIPVLSEDLIQELDKTYPHKCPPKGATLEEIQRYAGRRELIDELLIWLEQTKKKSKEFTANVPLSRTP